MSETYFIITGKQNGPSSPWSEHEEFHTNVNPNPDEPNQTNGRWTQCADLQRFMDSDGCYKWGHFKTKKKAQEALDKINRNHYSFCKLEDCSVVKVIKKEDEWIVDEYKSPSEGDTCYYLIKARYVTEGFDSKPETYVDPGHGRWCQTPILQNYMRYAISENQDFFTSREEALKAIKKIDLDAYSSIKLEDIRVVKVKLVDDEWKEVEENTSRYFSRREK
jgi:hypothetical protein